MPRLLVLGIGAIIVFRVLASVGDSIDSAPSSTADARGEPDSQPSFDGPLLATGESFRVDTAYPWRGTVYGYVPVSTADLEDPPGLCAVVIGAITVGDLAGGLVSDGSRAPTVGAVSGGDYVAGDSAACDARPFIEAGWGPIREANITEDTFYAFYETVYFPPGSDGLVDAIAVGDDNDAVRAAFVPDIFVDVVAAPIGEPGAPAALGIELQPVGSGPATQFDLEAFGALWQGSITGTVEVDPVAGFDGRCLVVLGSLAGFPDGDATGFSLVPISVVVAGREQQGGESRCATDDVQAAGYRGGADLPRSSTAPVPFFRVVALPSALFGPVPPDPDVVVIGPSRDPTAALFEPTVLDAIPAP